jgi:hypothetical protein
MTLRFVAALVTALAVLPPPTPAACASARAAAALRTGAAPGPDTAPRPPASPFPQVPLEPVAPRRSHAASYVVMAVGGGLVGASFAWHARANRVYDDYLDATEPDVIARLYDRTTRYDRLASCALIGGEAVIAAGLWMRFARHPRSDRVVFAASTQRCALTLRF